MARKIVLSGVLLGALLTACGRADPRLEKLSVGIPRDSVMVLMGAEQPARIDPYLMNRHYIEALYFKKPGSDTTKQPDRKMSPVIVIDGKLAAWGWKRWDSIAVENKIVVEKR